MVHYGYNSDRVKLLRPSTRTTRLGGAVMTSPLPHPNFSLDNWKENSSTLHDERYWTLEILWKLCLAFFFQRRVCCNEINGYFIIGIETSVLGGFVPDPRLQTAQPSAQAYRPLGWVGMSATLCLGEPSPEPWSLFLKSKSFVRWYRASAQSEASAMCLHSPSKETQHGKLRFFLGRVQID